MNFLKIIIYYGVLLKTLLLEPLQLCVLGTEDVCIPCDRNSSIWSQCIEITSQMKMISFQTNDYIDYDKYLNSSVRMIDEPKMVTFYTCFGKMLQVSKQNYYPINCNLHFINNTTLEDGGSKALSAKFQVCMEIYCHIGITNRFSCHNNEVDSFEFVFTMLVTTTCIQNITYAYIYSNVVTELRPNSFFRHAFNLIYLKLDFENLFTFSCHTFNTLFNLRVINFLFNPHISFDYNCIFEYNPNLISVSMHNLVIWNQCENKGSDNMVVDISRKFQSHQTKVGSSFAVYYTLITLLALISIITIILGVYLCVELNVCSEILRLITS